MPRSRIINSDEAQRNHARRLCIVGLLHCRDHPVGLFQRLLDQHIRLPFRRRPSFRIVGVVSHRQDSPRRSVASKKIPLGDWPIWLDLPPSFALLSAVQSPKITSLHPNLTPFQSLHPPNCHAEPARFWPCEACLPAAGRNLLLLLTTAKSLRWAVSR